MKYILDASVVAKLFLPKESEQANIVQALFAEAYANTIQLFAPPLLLFEVNNALIKSTLRQEDRESCIDDLLGLVDDGVLQIVPYSSVLLKKAGEIADLETEGGYISSYDASYHALALIEQGVFLTDDRRHIRKTEQPVGHILALDEWNQKKRYSV